MSDPFTSLSQRVKDLEETEKRKEASIARLVELEKQQADEVRRLNKLSVEASDTLEEQVAKVRQAKKAFADWHDEKMAELDAKTAKLAQDQVTFDNQKQEFEAEQTAMLSNFKKGTDKITEGKSLVDIDRAELTKQAEKQRLREQKLDKQAEKLDSERVSIKELKAGLSHSQELMDEMVQKAKDREQESIKKLAQAHDKEAIADKNLKESRTKLKDVRARETAIEKRRVELDNWEGELNKKAVMLADRDRTGRANQKLLTKTSE